MIKSKAIELYRSLSAKEARDLGGFLSVSFLNSNKALPVLHGYIMSHSPEFNIDDLTYQNISSKVYPGKKFNEAAVRNLLSDLSEAQARFLAVKKHFSNSAEMLKDASGALFEKALYTESLKYIDKLKAQIESSGKKDSLYHYYSFIEQDGRCNAEIIGFNVDKYTAISQQHVLTSAMTYSGMLIMENYIAISTINLAAGAPVDAALHEKIRSLFKATVGEDEPVYHIYLSYMDFILQQTPESYYAFKGKFIDNEKLFSYINARNLFLALRIYTTNMSASTQGMLSEQLDILFKMAEKGYLGLFENAYISDIEYKNFVIIGCLYGFIDRADEFLEQNKIHLPPNTAAQNYSFCKANVLFYRKDYNASLKMLVNTGNTDHNLKLNVESLMLRNYYELGMNIEAVSKAQNILAYIKSNRHVNTDERKYFKRFCDFFITAVKLVEQGNKKKLSSLLEKITPTPMVFKKWLTEKIKNALS